MTRADVLQVALALRDLRESYPDAEAALAWPDGTVICATRDGVVVRTPSERELRFSDEALDDLTRMGVA